LVVGVAEFKRVSTFAALFSGNDLLHGKTKHREVKKNSPKVLVEIKNSLPLPARLKHE